MQKMNPKKYGLTTRTNIYRKNNGDILIEKNRKSRIIMKDGVNIIKIAKKIKEGLPHQKIIFTTNAPLCSKTKLFLEQNRIGVELTE